MIAYIPNNLCTLALLFAFASVVTADQPQATKPIAIQHDIAYRDGPSKAWRLDLAFAKGNGGKPQRAVKSGLAVVRDTMLKYLNEDRCRN